MGPELIAMAQSAAPYLAVGGTAASMLGERQAQKQRRGILNQQMARTAQTQKDATGEVLAEAKNYAPDARQQAMQAAEAAAAQRSIADLGGAGGALIDTAGDAGNVSADFLSAKADRAISEGNRMTSLARELAKVRAPGDTMTAEGMRRADLTGRLGSKWGSTNNMGQAAQLDADSVSTPWWGQLGKLAAGVGTAGLMMPAAAPAMLGEGVASGIPAWDEAFARVPRWTGR